MEFAAKRYPGARVHIIGLCSGAYHGFKAAAAGLPLSSIVVVNPLTFFWKPGMSLEYADFQVTSETNRYARSSRSLSSWLKLLRGQVDLRNGGTRVLETFPGAREKCVAGTEAPRRLQAAG